MVCTDIKYEASKQVLDIKNPADTKNKNISALLYSNLTDELFLYCATNKQQVKHPI